ncbi:DUF2079 domain-containing protein [Actinocorallia sp. API 0066]|uniref:DUF2079 domain-containing protein n=1 Tax=Actinocorallia sp. API 0066 TaxID=2896846 RepID=UPI001E2B6706|nr:DUF2079 domain-containing protein [Actinocorallia sp. API 0066]MCD0453090.1 DUF2079 domain-containing protein [Actinocorallia sp. API 0066]
MATTNRLAARLTHRTRAIMFPENRRPPTVVRRRPPTSGGLTQVECGVSLFPSVLDTLCYDAAVSGEKGCLMHGADVRLPDSGERQAGSRNGCFYRSGRPFLVASVFALLYSVVSLRLHANMQTAAYDLGIFDQAVRGYARFEAPIVPIKGDGFHLLGDHFHPILMLLAPVYWVWPDPRALLVAQAVLAALAMVPLGRFAVARLGDGPGTAITVAFGLSWGVVGLVTFDFHEVVFALPITACCLVALAEGRWRRAALWALALLLVKEDMGLTVAAVGAYLGWKRQWAWGAGTVLAGLAAIPVTTLLIIPRFHPEGRYAYFGAKGGRTSGPLETLLGFPGSFVEHPEKAVFVALVLGTTCLLAFRTPLVLIAAPGLALRLTSENPAYWDFTQVHYNGQLMVILFVAAVVGASGLGIRRSRYACRAVLAVVVVLLPWTALQKPFVTRIVVPNEHAAAARVALSRIPDGVVVATTNHLAAQLTHRTQVIMFPEIGGRTFDWVAVDLRRRSSVPRSIGQQDEALARLPGQGFHKVVEIDGVVVYHRP